jgi:hypothetical protein
MGPVGATRAVGTAAVTLMAVPVATWVRPTVTGADGPKTVSQVSAMEFWVAAIVGVVTNRVAITVSPVPVAGVNVKVTCWLLVAPAQADAMVKLNCVATLVEETDRLAGLGNTTAAEEDVTVTFTAAPAVTNVIPTVPGVGPVP